MVDSCIAVMSQWSLTFEVRKSIHQAVMAEVERLVAMEPDL